MSSKGKRKSEDFLQPEKVRCIENEPKLATINEMSTELLEMIFQRLPRHERIICKEVCSRWFSILMESPLFDKDRHIHFKNCVVNAYVEPMSTILDAKYPYETFTFSEIENDTELDIEKAAEMLRVTKAINFCFTKHNAMLLQMLLEVPLLESIGFYEQNNEAYDDSRTRLNLKTFAKENPNIYFKKVKTVTVSLVSKNTEDYVHDFLEPLSKMIPKDSIIYVYVNFWFDVFLNFDKEIECWTKLISAHGKRTKLLMNKVSLHFLRISNETIENFFAIDVTFKKFELVYNTYDKYDMDKFLDRIKADKIILSLEVVPQIPNNFHRISKVVLDQPVGENLSLKWLEKMENLKKLVITSYFEGTSCAFGHEAIKLDKLEKIEFKHDILVTCQKCLSAFRQSFENLRKIDIFGHSSFLLVIQCWKKLEKLTLKLDEFDVIEEKGIQEFPLHSLRVLIIKHANNYLYSYSKISSYMKQMFPKLEKFVYNYQDF